MNVLSSVASIVNGTNLQGGNIEFWPSNYSAPNGAGVPGASDTLYDWGDTRTAGNYGSMQIHNSEVPQVLLAFNRWGGTGGNADVGIGNQPPGNPLSANPDWTFAQNSTNYIVRTLQVFALPVSNNNAPVLISAFGQPGWTNIVVNFSKALDESATNITYYTVNGGVKVLSAVLDPITKTTVTLFTTPQQPFAPYTVTVNGVTDRTKNRLPIAANANLAFTSSPSRGAANNVAEAAAYNLVYSLDIPNTPNYANGMITYDINQSGAISDFTRIAYYLELQQSGGPLNFLWASMDAFSTNVTQIGVPTILTGVIFQQPVANMNVVSSVSGIVTGTNLTGGNIEFWPSNYNQQNTGNVPNASATAYDFGDNPTAGNYGSMQVHNHDASQVLFAFNRWGGTGGTADLGIGNRPGSADLDWTFAQNAAAYAIKTLQVYVLPVQSAYQPFKILSTQRNAAGQFSLSWEAKPGTAYSIQRKQNLDATPWTKVGGTTATTAVATFIDLQATNTTSFYRISVP